MASPVCASNDNGRLTSIILEGLNAGGVVTLKTAVTGVLNPNDQLTQPVRSMRVTEQCIAHVPDIELVCCSCKPIQGIAGEGGIAMEETYIAVCQ